MSTIYIIFKNKKLKKIVASTDNKKLAKLYLKRNPNSIVKKINSDKLGDKVISELNGTELVEYTDYKTDIIGAYTYEEDSFISEYTPYILNELDNAVSKLHSLIKILKLSKDEKETILIMISSINQFIMEIRNGEEPFEYALYFNIERVLKDYKCE